RSCQASVASGRSLLDETQGFELHLHAAARDGDELEIALLPGEVALPLMRAAGRPAHVGQDLAIVHVLAAHLAPAPLLVDLVEFLAAREAADRELVLAKAPVAH